MSGECDKCGEHCLDCKCIENHILSISCLMKDKEHVKFKLKYKNIPLLLSAILKGQKEIENSFGMNKLLRHRPVP